MVREDLAEEVALVLRPEGEEVRGKSIQREESKQMQELGCCVQGAERWPAWLVHVSARPEWGTGATSVQDSVRQSSDIVLHITGRHCQVLGRE